MPTSVPVLRTGEFLFKTTSNITECSLVSFKKIVGYVPSGDLGGRHWRDGFWSKKVSENPQNTINNIRNFRALNGFFGNLVRQNLFFVPPSRNSVTSLRPWSLLACCQQFQIQFIGSRRLQSF